MFLLSVVAKFIDWLETKMTDIDPSIVRQHVQPLKNNYFKAWSHITIPVLDLSSSETYSDYIPSGLYADASFNNLPDSRSQQGDVIFLCDQHHNSAPIAWSSAQIEHITQSALAAETVALMDGCAQPSLSLT